MREGLFETILYKNPIIIKLFQKYVYKYLFIGILRHKFDYTYFMHVCINIHPLGVGIIRDENIPLHNYICIESIYILIMQYASTFRDSVIIIYKKYNCIYSYINYKWA